MPFLFKDLPAAWAVRDGPVGERLAAAAKGLVLLAPWDNGIRHVSNNVRSIMTPEDLSGPKLRTPPDPVTVDIIEALVASPAPPPFSELYVALQQGVVDGQENPLMNIHSSKIFEVQKYISPTAHKYESTQLFASKVVFDGFSPEDQAAIREAAGVAINDVDPAPFATLTAGVQDEWRAKFPELVDLVKQEAAKAASGQ